MNRWMTIVAMGGILITSAHGQTGLPDASGEGADQGGKSIPQVLTPARLEQPRSEVPASVTVVDRELIEATGARELYDVLKLVPGMSAVKVDGNKPTVSYHGTMARDVRRMLVLIDGRSVYRPGLARVEWNNLPVAVDDVARIEVTRGPNSASYGANAFSGVINIITRHSRDISTTTAEARTGNNGVSDQRLTSGGNEGGFSWRYTLQQQNDDGYDDGYDPDYRDNDQLYRDAKTVNRGNLRAGWDLSPTDELEFFAGGASTRLQRPPNDAFLQFVEYRDEPTKYDESAFAQLRWQHDFSPQHSLKMSVFSQYSDSHDEMDLCANPVTSQPATGAIFFTKEMRDVFLQEGNIEDTVAAIGDPAYPDLNDRLNKLDNSDAGTFCGEFSFDVVEKRHDLEVQDTLHVGDWGKLVTGINLRHDRGHSETYLTGTAENYSQRAFGTLEIEVIEPVLLNVGGFWEKDDINGEFFNPRGAVIIKPTQGHALRAVYSEAVRTSDLYEARARTNLTAENLTPAFASDKESLLGWNTPHFFATQTSPGSLGAEKIESRELGYYGRFGTLEFDIRHFEEELRNLISGTLNPFTFNAEERNQVDLRGWETQVSWRPVPDHLLRVTNAHIHNESSTKIETRLSPRDSGSFLWRYDLSSRWMVSTAYYLAHDYNRKGGFADLLPFERADVMFAHRRPVGGSWVNLKARVQHYVEDEPVVFKENRYAEDTHYQVAFSLEF